MKIINCWDIQVYDGADRHHHRHYVATKEAADAWMEKNKYDAVYEKQFVIHDSYEDLMNHVQGEARRRALAKLTEEDKIALGLK